MKGKLQIIVGASAASVLGLSILAQVTPAPNSGAPENHPGGRMAQGSAGLNDVAKTSDLL